MSTILLSVAALIAILLLLALVMKKEHMVSREIEIKVSVDEVFQFLRYLQNQEQFNKWAKTDAERQIKTIGSDGKVGYIFAWSGNKEAGVGEKEIKAIEEGKRIETEIRFTKPMKMQSTLVFETEGLNQQLTKVRFINKGRINFPLNLLIPLAERNFAKDMDESLLNLKQLLEKE